MLDDHLHGVINTWYQLDHVWLFVLTQMVIFRPCGSTKL